MYKFTPIVPAYFFPTIGDANWKKLFTGNPDGTRIIFNPASGPGVARDESYGYVTAKVRRANAKPIGYVDSNFGAVAQATVISQIQSYASFYPECVEIFLDRTPSTAGFLSYLTAIRDQVLASFGSGAKLFANAGQQIAAALQALASVVTINFEGSKAGFDTTYLSFPASQFKLDPATLGCIIHTIADQTNLDQAFDRMAYNNYGFVYVTDGVLATPYAALSSYWEQLKSKALGVASLRF